MRARFVMVFCSVVLLLCAALATTQDCLQPVGRWPYGVATDVAAEGTLAVFGNGAVVQVLDVSDPSAPVVLGEVRTTLLIDAVALAGDRAFAADRNTLYVIDIGTPTAPAILGQLPRVNTQAIDVAGHRVFIAGGNLDIVDVSSPAAPVILGSWTDLPTGDVKVFGDHAVVSVFYDGLRVLDISHPSAPEVVGELGLDPGLSAERIDLVGNHAFVAGSVDRLFSVDLTNPAQPVLLDLVGGAGSDVAVSGGLALVTDIGGLDVWDVSDPADLQYRGGVGIWSNDVKRVAAINGYALVSNDLHGLAVVDVADPTNPVIVGELDAPGRTRGADWSDGLLAIAADIRGLRLVDVADPAHPVDLGTVEIPYMIAFDVEVNNGWAYVTGVGATGFAVVDIRNPSAPAVVATIAGSWSGDTIRVADGLAFVGCGDPGLRIVDVSVPTSPTEIGTLALSGYQWPGAGMDLSGNTVALRLIGPSARIEIVDVSVPAAPAPVASIEALETGMGSLSMSGSWLLVGDIPLRIFDLSDPANPVERPPYLPIGGGGFIDHVGVAGTVAYLGSLWPSNVHRVEAVDVGDPLNASSMGLSTDLDGGWPLHLAFSDREVFVLGESVGFDILALCQGPLFADGFETGNTTAWTSAVP